MPLVGVVSSPADNERPRLDVLRPAPVDNRSTEATPESATTRTLARTERRAITKSVAILAAAPNQARIE